MGERLTRERDLTFPLRFQPTVTLYQLTLLLLAGLPLQVPGEVQLWSCGGHPNGKTHVGDAMQAWLSCQHVHVLYAVLPAPMPCKSLQ